MKRESDRFGRKIKVPDEYGITEEYTLLFSFGYDEGEYVVVIGDSTNDDLYVCKEISGSLWNGSVILEDVPDLKVIELSDKLFSLFMLKKVIIGHETIPFRFAFGRFRVILKAIQQSVQG